LSLKPAVIEAIRRNAEEAGGIIMVADPNDFGAVRRAETVLCAELDRLRDELANAKAGADSACKNVAAMHAAAMGRVCAPVLGTVEDVKRLRDNYEAATQRATGAHAELRTVRAELAKAQHDLVISREETRRTSELATQWRQACQLAAAQGPIEPGAFQRIRDAEAKAARADATAAVLRLDLVNQRDLLSAERRRVEGLTKALRDAENRVTNLRLHLADVGDSVEAALEADQ
jgi:hypothetical protein